MAFTDAGMAVFFRPELEHGIIHMDKLQVLKANQLIELADEGG